MSKKTKKQNRRQHNKRTSPTGSGTCQAPSKKQDPAVTAKKNVKAAKVKTKYILTDKVKTIGSIAICVVMVLAFAIPTGLTAFTNPGTSNANQVEEVQTSSVSLTGVTRDQKEAFDETGKFDNFLVIDEAGNIHEQDLYDSYLTIEEARILNERSNASNESATE